MPDFPDIFVGKQWMLGPSLRIKKNGIGRSPQWKIFSRDLHIMKIIVPATPWVGAQLLQMTSAL